ncbi:S-layer homology domain-containing protein, partial [Tyzzerella sp. OttesenSCG-928-J15]|nr:S-layer homology domain-containing protein [Tyzzerella sp. OttesenSCG-928-J15]
FTMPAENVEIKAIFEPIPVTGYTVSYNANGGTGFMADDNVNTGAAYTIKANAFGRSGHHFTGWRTAPNGGAYYSPGANISAVNGDITLYAQWALNSGNVEDDNSNDYDDYDNNSNGSSSSGQTGGGNTITGSGSWSNMVDKAENLKNGGSMTIDMNGTSTVPPSFLDAIAGKDVEITFKMGSNLSWVINGKDVPDSNSSLNLGVNKGTTYVPAQIRNIDGSISQVQLRLSHNGAFGLKLTLAVTLEKQNAGHWANLFYYNSATKELEFQAAVKVSSNGKANFAFEHASDYLIVVSKDNLKPAEVTQSTEPVAEMAAQNSFSDVNPSDWFYGDVEYAVANGLFSGTSATTFSPATPMSRAMLVSVLWRLEGSPVVDEVGMYANFADVAQGAYYENAVGWAAKNGIVSGYGEGFFGPDDSVTREQLAAILYRYIQYQGGGFKGTWAFPLAFDDAENVSEWAYEAMCYCTMNGILSGKEGNRLDPKANATRAETAAVLHRLAENM